MKEQAVLNGGEVVCPNCGVIGSEQHLFCSGCGMSLKTNNVEVATHENNSKNNINNGMVYVTSNNFHHAQQQTTDKGYIPWIAVAYLGAPCGFLLCFLSSAFLVAGGLVSLVSAIYAKSKYPNVFVVKFTFWFILIIYVLAIVAFLYFIYLFVSSCNSCIQGIA